MRLEVKPAAELGDDERAALRALTAAVYPPDAVAARPGRHVRWAPVDFSVLVWDPEGELVSHVGLVVRAGTLDGAAVTIGGVGSVKTHPRAEGRGYASAGLRRAAAILRDEHRVAFSLLVCQEHLLSFYARLGWLAFPGRLVVEQPSGPTVFTINRAMVLPGLRPAPGDGTIDLNGLPW
jgi:hypothetical protein